VTAEAFFSIVKNFEGKAGLYHASSFSPAILILLHVDITNEGIQRKQKMSDG
jgi:hypothetical protein